MHSFLQLGASEAAHKQAAARLSEAERSGIIAEDQQTVQYRACTDLEEQVAAGRKALTEALGRDAAAERALLLEADAAKVWALKEAERQRVEAEQAHTRAQENADRQIAEGAQALRNAISRVNELEKQMAHPEKGSKVVSHVLPTCHPNNDHCCASECVSLQPELYVPSCRHAHLWVHCLLGLALWLLGGHQSALVDSFVKGLCQPRPRVLCRIVDVSFVMKTIYDRQLLGLCVAKQDGKCKQRLFISNGCYECS